MMRRVKEYNIVVFERSMHMQAPALEGGADMPMGT
jgi:hypothetical protein